MTNCHAFLWKQAYATVAASWHKMRLVIQFIKQQQALMCIYRLLGFYVLLYFIYNSYQL